MNAILVFLIFIAVGARAEVNDQAILDLARKDAISKLDRIKTWMVTSGQLQTDLVECDPKSNVFDPAFEAPAKESNTFQSLSKLLPTPKLSIVDLGAPKDTDISKVVEYDFVRFAACEIEFRMHMKYEAKSLVRSSHPWEIQFEVDRTDLSSVWMRPIAETRIHTVQKVPKPAIVGNVGDALVRCEPIAALGVLPIWICEVGTSDQWYADFGLLYEIEKWPDYMAIYKDPVLAKLFHRILFDGK